MEANKYAIITIGISGAGKTTWAKKLINHNELDGEFYILPEFLKGREFVRVNYDDIRKSLVGDLVEPNYYSRPNVNTLENIVFLTASNMLENINLMRGNLIPIFDNTNLRIKDITDLVNQLEQFEYNVLFKFFTIKPGIAVNRVFHRDFEEVENNSGRTDYIDRQYQQYLTLRQNFNEHFKNYFKLT